MSHSDGDVPSRTFRASHGRPPTGFRARMADPIRASPLQSRIPPSLLLPPRCKDPHLRPRGRRAMPRNGKYCDTPSAPASDPGLRPRRRQSDVRSHFPAPKYRIRSPSISAESPDPALPAHCTDGIPGSAAAGFLWLFHSASVFPPTLILND